MDTEWVHVERRGPPPQVAPSPPPVSALQSLPSEAAALATSVASEAAKTNEPQKFYFEWQRWVIFSGWSSDFLLPGDPNKYTSITHHYDQVDFAPEQCAPGSVKIVTSGDKTDDCGWTYARTPSSVEWSASQGATTFVRRRRLAVPSCGDAVRPQQQEAHRVTLSSDTVAATQVSSFGYEPVQQSGSFVLQRPHLSLFGGYRVVWCSRMGVDSAVHVLALCETLPPLRRFFEERIAPLGLRSDALPLRRLRVWLRHLSLRSSFEPLLNGFQELCPAEGAQQEEEEECQFRDLDASVTLRILDETLRDQEGLLVLPYVYCDKVSSDLCCRLCCSPARVPAVRVTHPGKESRSFLFCLQCARDNGHTVALRDRDAETHLNGLRVRCPFEGCGEAFPRKHWTRHLRSCGALEFRCPQMGCGVALPRYGQMVDHWLLCDKAAGEAQVRADQRGVFSAVGSEMLHLVVSFLELPDIVSLSCANKYFRVQVMEAFQRHCCRVCGSWHQGRERRLFHPGTWDGLTAQEITSRRRNVALQRARQMLAKLSQNRGVITGGLLVAAAVAGVAAAVVAEAPLVAAFALVNLGGRVAMKVAGQGGMKAGEAPAWTCCLQPADDALGCQSCDGESLSGSI